MVLQSSAGLIHTVVFTAVSAETGWPWDQGTGLCSTWSLIHQRVQWQSNRVLRGQAPHSSASTAFC